MVIFVLFSCNLATNVPITLASDYEDTNTRIDLYHNIDITWNKYIKGIKYIVILCERKGKWKKLDQIL